MTRHDRTTFRAVCARLRAMERARPGFAIDEGADVIEHLMARDRALRWLIALLAVIAVVAMTLLIRGWP